MQPQFEHGCQNKHTSFPPESFVFLKAHKPCDQTKEKYVDLPLQGGLRHRRTAAYIVGSKRSDRRDRNCSRNIRHNLGRGLFQTAEDSKIRTLQAKKGHYTNQGAKKPRINSFAESWATKYKKGKVMLKLTPYVHFNGGGAEGSVRGGPQGGGGARGSSLRQSGPTEYCQTGT